MRWLAFFAFVKAFSQITSMASGANIPEPGLVVYGVVRSPAVGNARLLSGTLTWILTSANGFPVIVSIPLTDIGGQYSYILRVPFESLVGSGTLSPNTLRLNNSAASFVRTNVFLTVNGTNYPATISAPALGTFTFGPADRGRIERVDLSVSSPQSFAQWLVGYGLPTNSPANSDLLGKGMTLYQDFMAGTNPNDRNSLFKMETNLRPMLRVGQFAGITIEWDSVASKTYSVYRSTDLGHTFQPLQSAISATAPLNSFSDPTATGPGPYYYRIQVDP